MLEQLQNVFRAVFQDGSLIISETTTAKNIKMWDSLMHLELIAAVETAFKVEFSFNEVMSFNDVGDIMKVIEQKLK